MVPPRRASDAASERRFFLAETGADPPVLTPEDEQHARTVLRIREGDRVRGLDGAGREWPLVVRSVSRRAVVVEAVGEPREEPPPGAPDAALPHVSLFVSPPRGGRAEEMVDRLTQLGVAAIAPLIAERTPPQGRELSLARRTRLERAAREACKQSGRLWLPEVLAPVEWDELLRTAPADSTCLLGPGAPERLLDWCERERRRSFGLVAGPEGGFTPTELDGARGAGLAEARVARHVLRIETAAEAAAAIALHV